MPKFLKELEFVFDVLTLFFLDLKHFDFFDNIELFLFFVSTEKHISWRTRLQRISTLYRWAFLSRINPCGIVSDVLIYILNSESYKRRIIFYIRLPFSLFISYIYHFISNKNKNQIISFCFEKFLSFRHLIVIHSVFVHFGSI